MIKILDSKKNNFSFLLDNLPRNDLGGNLLHKKSVSKCSVNEAYQVLSDPERLPAHRHVMVVLHSFADDASGLPSWDFEADIVNPRTMFVVMPYFPKDLKRVASSLRRQGQEFGERRALRIMHGLLLAVRQSNAAGVGGARSLAGMVGGGGGGLASSCTPRKGQTRRGRVGWGVGGLGGALNKFPVLY